MFISSPFYRIRSLLNIQEVPGSRELNASLERVLPVLDSEDPNIRPQGSNRKPGGLILLGSVPTIIVPDLHARTGYLKALLAWTPPGGTNTVYQGLSAGKLQVVCVGDGFHAEARAVQRWKGAFEEYIGEYKKHKFIDAEMKESLAVMMSVMELKTAFPNNFHFLKGNHENIANEESADNRPFRKFVHEGSMVKLWFNKFIENETFKSYYRFEKKLPVFAVGNRFCISHAEPRRYYPKKELINALIQRKIEFDLTWTGNGEAENESVEKYLEEYFPGDKRSIIFGGHRPVAGIYQARAEGRYLQIHNPNRYIAVYIRNMQYFSPETNILVLPLEAEA